MQIGDLVTLAREIKRDTRVPKILTLCEAIEAGAFKIVAVTAAPKCPKCEKLRLANVARVRKFRQKAKL